MTINDGNFSESGTSVPAANGIAVTPSDSVNFSTRSRFLYVGVTGDVAVVMAGDQGDAVVLLTAVPAGSFLAIRAIRINSTNTTATNIAAFF